MKFNFHWISNQESLNFPYKTVKIRTKIMIGIIFWGNSSYSEDIFKIQKRIIRIIMDSSRNASCRQPFKDLNILPIRSQYIYSILYLLLKIKTNFCLTHKYIKSIQGKLWICTYLQQTRQFTKKASITQELRFTIIYQQPSKIYLVIRINLS